MLTKLQISLDTKTRYMPWIGVQMGKRLEVVEKTKLLEYGGIE
jgi:hypothetical protein